MKVAPQVSRKLPSDLWMAFVEVGDDEEGQGKEKEDRENNLVIAYGIDDKIRSEMPKQSLTCIETLRLFSGKRGSRLQFPILS